MNGADTEFFWDDLACGCDAHEATRRWMARALDDLFLVNSLIILAARENEENPYN